MTIDIKISSEETIEHEGKQYRPVAIRLAKKGEMFLSAGFCYRASCNHTRALVILEEVIPPYRTPTDEDAKQRPIAEFWDGELAPIKPSSGTLVAVIGGEWPFVRADEHRVTAYRHCRIANEQKA